MILRTSHFFSLSSSSPIPHQQIIDTQPPQPGPSGSKSSPLAGTSTHTSLIGTQQERRPHLVQRNAANAASRNMTRDANLEIVRKTGSCTKKEQHVFGCEYIYTVVNGPRLTRHCTAGVHLELRDQFIAPLNGKPRWSTKAFALTVREIDHHAVVSSGIFAHEFPDENPRARTKQVLITLEEATEAYMFEVTAASHCLKQQQISCRYTTCLLRWRGTEVMYSWNSPTCAWP